MDSPRTESFFFHPNKKQAVRPSQPIDIPAQPRAVSCPTTATAATRPLSPELIFDLDMDLISATSATLDASPMPLLLPVALPSNIGVSITATRNPREQHLDRGPKQAQASAAQSRLRPLLYPFPVLRLDRPAVTRTPAVPVHLNRARSSAALPSASLPPFPIAHVAFRRRSSDESSDEGYDTYKRDRNPAPVHKVVGFVPAGSESDKENQSFHSPKEDLDDHELNVLAPLPFPDVERGRSKTVKAGLQTPSPTPSPPRLTMMQTRGPLSAPATLSRVTARASFGRRTSGSASVSSNSTRASGSGSRSRRRRRRDESLGDIDNFAQFLRRRIEARSNGGVGAARVEAW